MKDNSVNHLNKQGIIVFDNFCACPIDDLVVSKLFQEFCNFSYLLIFASWKQMTKILSSQVVEDCKFTTC